MDESQQETIVVVGYGWVGQANALALKKEGYPVFFYDIGEPSLHYEGEYAELYASIPRLSSLLEKDGPNTWYVVCVGDRVSPEGEQDIEAIRRATETLRSARGGTILRATVLPGSLAELHFHYYVPEFLHEKKAVPECIAPHFFVIGSRDHGRTPPHFFGLWERRAIKVFRGTPEEAAYIKYLSNCWNAMQIAFVNEFGNSISLPKDKDHLVRIERVVNFLFEKKSYLRYGRAYSGHCLPKDTRAFTAWNARRGNDMPLFLGMCRSNDAHAEIEKIHTVLPEWYSEWAPLQLSGWVALRALHISVKKRITVTYWRNRRKK